MKRLPIPSITYETSHDNTSTVPAYAGRNKDLIQYLTSDKFTQDFEKAIREKAVTNG